MSIMSDRNSLSPSSNLSSDHCLRDKRSVSTDRLSETKSDTTENPDVQKSTTVSRAGSTDELIKIHRQEAESGNAESKSESNLADIMTSTENLELHALNSHGEVSQKGVSSEVNRSPRSYQGDSSSKHIAFKILEVVFLSVIVLMLLALYMIPTVFFVNPPLDFPPVSMVA